MNTTDATGGFLAPVHLDPSILVTNAGNVNPLRTISRNVTIATDAWNGVTSAGVTAEWLAEAAEAADASPVLAQPTIPDAVYKASAFTPFSYEIEGDGIGFMAELQTLLVDAYDNLTATAYVTGSGVGQPTGVITSLVASAATVPLVTPGTAETFTAVDVFATQNALPPRWQANARWCASLGFINAARAFESTAGAIRFPELAQNPPRLLGRAVNELSNMDGVLNPAASEQNYILLYGDFQQFVLVSRIGSTIELIPNLFGQNRWPTGQRGAFLWARTGSNVVIPNAFRLLSIPTMA